MHRFVQKSFFPVDYGESRKCNGVGGGGGRVAEPSKKKSVDSSKINFLVRGQKQVIKIRRKRIFP